MGRKFFHSRHSGSPMPDCWSCSKTLQPNWANCPFCGAEGADQNQCPQCEKHVDDSWEFCPNCGYTKGSGNHGQISPTNAEVGGFVATQPVVQSAPATQYTSPMNPQTPTPASHQVISTQNWQEFDDAPEKKKSGFRWGWLLFILLYIFIKIGIRGAATGGY